MYRFITPILATTLVLAIASCSPGKTQKQTEEPGIEATETDGPAPWTHGAMVAAGDPRAVEAGLKILRAGGNAVDAAIAVHAVLGLVEPQSSGLGGGAFMLYYDHTSGEITVFDGRETAPAGATPDMFMRDGEPLSFVEAWQSGRSVGVPGQVALYKAAHDAVGVADWASLFEPAIEIAESGFEVSPRLARFLSNEGYRNAYRLDDNPVTAAYFFPNGEPLAAGDIRDNPDYAATLAQIAAEGPDVFYTGALAEAIVAAAGEAPLGGTLSMEDLADYQVKVRAPLCGTHDDYRICSAPPPSSGGVAQNMIYGLYKRLLPTEGEMTEEIYLKAFVDAQRLTYADRDHYVADADVVSVPSEDLINPKYLDARAGDRFAPDASPTPGDPGEVLGRGSMIGMWGRDATIHAPGTTHISIIDKDGNAVSMTATIESLFGSSRMAGGFLLNNQLTDFSFVPTKSGLPVANAVAPGKRPRSSMSPSMVFDKNGRLFMVTGSPGGNSIIAYVAKTIVAVLDWGKSAQEAADLPNIIARGDKVRVEVATDNGRKAAEALRDMGYDVDARQGENSRLHLIIVREDGLEGGADSRGEGVVRTPEDMNDDNTN